MCFLFVDKITSLVANQDITGIKNVTFDDTYLAMDNAGRYYFPSSLVGETLGQLAAWHVMFANDFTFRPVAGVVHCAQSHEPVYVGSQLKLTSIIDNIDATAVHYHSVAKVNNTVVFTIEGALGPLLPMSQFIDKSVVISQFMQIYHPNEQQDSLTSVNIDAKLPGVAKQILPVFMFDKIISCEPGKSMLAEKLITPAAPYFADHFPLNPVLPLTVLLETKINLAGLFLEKSGFAQTYRIEKLRRIKMNGFVYPGNSLICLLTVVFQDANQLILQCRSEVNSKRVCIVEIVMQSTGE